MMKHKFVPAALEGKPDWDRLVLGAHRDGI